MIPPEKKIERMVNVARLYYEENMTQNEIAKKTGYLPPPGKHFAHGSEGLRRCDHHHQSG